MGLVKPVLPDLDYETWRQQPRMQRVKPMVKHWAEAGFGTPEGVYAIYIVKIALYVLGAAAVIRTTVDGLGPIGELDSWTEPIVFEKVVLFTLLFEVLGLGCGFGPLTLRFLPPIGTFLYWLRPGTIRLPPWPSKVPFTRGWSRSIVDVALYLGVIGTALYALLAPADRASEGIDSIGIIEPSRIIPLLVVLPLLGLRDKTIFLAARFEVYGTLTIFFLLPGVDLIVGAKLMLLAIWWGAATSKLNKHFDYVVSVMMSNSPLLRVKAIKRKFHRNWPEDIRPSKISTALAHGGTVIEFLVPLALFSSRGGTLTTVAAIIMVSFHLLILSSLPMGVPLEWNVFMIFCIGYLFGHYADYGFADLTQPGWVALIMVVVAGVVIIGNLYPTKLSFLPAMRYYAGNWDTSLWCLTPAAVAKIETHVKKAAKLPRAQLVKIYGEELADLLSHKGYAFRAMHTHGRALFGLIPRACGETHETDYAPIDGEFLAGTVLGWNFGDGHLHNECLIEALQERCHFDEGEVRVIIMIAQPIHQQRQEYRIVDPAAGELERGYVKVSDMLAGQAWDGEIPTTVVSSTIGATGRVGV